MLCGIIYIRCYLNGRRLPSSGGLASLQTVFLILKGFGPGFTREEVADMIIVVMMVVLGVFVCSGKIIVNVNIRIKNKQKNNRLS